MANQKKAIFFPDKEAEITAYYNQIFGLLSGAMGTKYNTSAATLLELGDHNTQIPLVLQKAHDDSQIAQGSNATKDTRLANAEEAMRRELNRITGLSNWDEADGQTAGFRKEKTPVDLDTVQGKISKTTALPEKNVIDWIKAGMDGIIIEALEDVQQEPGPPPPPPTQDSPDWKRIGTDTRSPFEDERPNKTSKPENRYYRIRYIKDDKPVGLYSDIKKVLTDIQPQPAP